MKASSRVVGMQAGGRMHIVSQVAKGDPVLLVPEPDNPHDAHAVAVFTAPASALQDTDSLMSSVSDPGHVGNLSDVDRRLLIDRQAGYIPRDLASQLDLPAQGIVGFVSAVRYAPDSEPAIPAGFDVTAWFTRRSDRTGGWGK